MNLFTIGSSVLLSLILEGAVFAQTPSEPNLLNRKDDGYRGIWYSIGETKDEYRFKYSGGLGTYTANHQPMAVYCAKVHKTFFAYGGATAEDNQKLVHMVSYFDHQTKSVPQPTILLDKQTSDAHDNPVLTVDQDGYLWIVSTSHGRERPSFVSKSVRPYSIEAFETVLPRYERDGKVIPMEHLSYVQLWQTSDTGMAMFFTRYRDPVHRTSIFATSTDGVLWHNWQRLGAAGAGHYQLSASRDRKLAAVCNFHPGRPGGSDFRTNLYYMETTDRGKHWTTPNSQPLTLPLTSESHPSLVRDYAAEGQLVYLMDIQLDAHGRPAILYLRSPGHKSGPVNDPRIWVVAKWTGQAWSFHDVTTSDSNYDMGSLYLEPDGTWRIIAPTIQGPQKYNPGGEMAMWVSPDQGESWTMTRQLTSASNFNHTYARRPVDAHPDFYAFWADGNPRESSASTLYFCTKVGDVFVLPRTIPTEIAHPLPLK